MITGYASGLVNLKAAWLVENLTPTAEQVPDVDDLEEISALERYIDETCVILIFLPKMAGARVWICVILIHLPNMARSCVWSYVILIILSLYSHYTLRVRMCTSFAGLPNMAPPS